jgi:hypothetical protein
VLGRRSHSGGGRGQPPWASMPRLKSSDAAGSAVAAGDATG